MSLFTPQESKAVGLTGGTIRDFPSLVEVEQADRLQLVRWYRFLVSPPDKQCALILERIIDRLRVTCPQEYEH